MVSLYAARYESGDISAVIIDLLVGVAAGAFSFVSLIVLVLLYRWVTRTV